MTVLELFAGIGGLGLGLERAGFTVIGQVEIDPFCRRVLAKHWPEVPRHDDVRTAVEWWRSEQRPAVHVVAGGFPCQPVSEAGRGMAEADPRWEWPAMLAVVEAVRPEWVVAENVPGLRRHGLDAVVAADLRRAGYRVRVGEASACSVGASHPRRRLFFLAHTESEGWCPWRVDGSGSAATRREDEEERGSERRAGWAPEPGVGRSLDGFSTWLDRSGRLSESHKLVLAHANAARQPAVEIVRALRRSHRAPDEEWPTGGRGSLSATAVLLAFLRQLQGVCAAGNTDVASSAAPETDLRELRLGEVASRSPRQRRSQRRTPGEPTDALHPLPQLLARASEQAWAAYRRSDAGAASWGWEDGLERVAYGVPSGVDRRRALGNAVVPQVGEYIGRLIFPWSPIGHWANKEKE